MKLLRALKWFKESLTIERKVTQKLFSFTSCLFSHISKEKIKPLEIFGFKKHKIYGSVKKPDLCNSNYRQFWK